MKPEDRLADIQSLQEDLLEFERKYGMRSEEFYAAYSRGEEPENSEWVLDFGEWSSVWRTLERLGEEISRKWRSEKTSGEILREMRDR